MAPIVGVEPSDLASSGWGVVFCVDEDPALREALRPLLEHRKQQAGDLYQEFSYRPDESKVHFLSRYGVGPGPADPHRVPYHLLLVGSPEEISYRFQSELDLQYAVGRIFFDDLDSFRNYAESVVKAEMKGPRNPRRLTFFGVHNQGDPATNRLRKELVEPLVARISGQDTGWTIDSVVGEEANKRKLARLLGGENTPSFLFTASHGMFFPSGHEKQFADQGAVVCSNWQGSVGDHRIKPDHYFAASDVPDNADLLGLLIFQFGCFTAGTPEFDGFEFGERLRTIAPRPFVAALAQTLLGHPNGGALALIGNIDRAWTLSWSFGPEGPQLGTYFSSLTSIMEGQTIGHAMEYFNHRFAELAAQMSNIMSDREGRVRMEAGDIDQLRRAAVDAQNFVIIGDPAVSLRKIPAREASVRTKQRRKKRIKEKAREREVGGRTGATNDEVSQVDLLEYRPYIEAFADLIDSPDTSPPLTIGIFGSWGIGKSFLLKHIHWELERRQEDPETRSSSDAPSVHVIDFNAWEYSANEKIWPGLVRKIMNEMERRLPWSLVGRLVARVRLNLGRQISKHRSKIIFTAILLATGLVIIPFLPGIDDPRVARQVLLVLFAGGIAKFASDIIANPVSQWVTQLFQREDYGRRIGFMEEIESDLKYLDKKLKKGDRILLVIDDLDRCEPGKAVEMLQAIKLLLDFKRFVVCLGIDAQIISCAVEKQYEGLLSKAGTTGHEYLEKIVQIPFRIPTPSPDDMHLFIRGILKALPDENERPTAMNMAAADAKAEPLDGEKEPAHAALHPQSPEETSWPLAPPSAPDGADQVALRFSADEEEVFLRFIPYLRFNPRHIKRVINIYRLVRAIANRKRDLITLRNPEGTILWVVLCVQWPQALERILGELDVLLLGAEKSQDWESLNEDPLRFLLERIKFGAQAGRDYRYHPLMRLISDEQIPRIDLLDLRRLRQYAIHFTPSADSARQIRPTGSQAAAAESRSL